MGWNGFDLYQNTKAKQSRHSMKSESTSHPPPPQWFFFLESWYLFLTGSHSLLFYSVLTWVRMMSIHLFHPTPPPAVSWNTLFFPGGCRTNLTELCKHSGEPTKSQPAPTSKMAALGIQSPVHNHHRQCWTPWLVITCLLRAHSH